MTEYFPKGLVTLVVTEFSGDYLDGDHSIGATTLQVNEVVDFPANGGIVQLMDTGLTATYTAVDPDGKTLALSSPLPIAVPDNTEVRVYPDNSRKIAWIRQESEDMESVPSVVPYAMMPLLKEGPRDEVTGYETVTLKQVGDDVVIDQIFDPPESYDSGLVPIVTSTQDGEKVVINGDGLTAFTDNQVFWTNLLDECRGVCTDGTSVWIATRGAIFKYDAATGEKLTPLEGYEDTESFPDGDFQMGDVAYAGGFVYVHTINTSLSHFTSQRDAETGAITGSSFPSGHAAMGGNDSWVFTRKPYSESSHYMHKFDHATLTEVVTGGWPVSTPSGVADIAASDNYVYAIRSDGILQKFDIATGVEITGGGWPVNATPRISASVAYRPEDNNLYVMTWDDISVPTNTQIDVRSPDDGSLISTIDLGSHVCSSVDVRNSYIVYEKDFLSGSTDRAEVATIPGELYPTSKIESIGGRIYARSLTVVEDVLLTGVVSADWIMPPGTVLPFGGVKAPAGFLLCNGQAVSRDTYSHLFAVISTFFGSGDGSTTFNVPTLVNRFPRGWDGISNPGASGGATTHSHNLSNNGNAKIELASTGAIYADRTTTPSFTADRVISGGTAAASSSAFTTAVGLDGTTDSGSTLPPYVTMLYIIKF